MTCIICPHESGMRLLRREEPNGMTTDVIFNCSLRLAFASCIAGVA